MFFSFRHRNISTHWNLGVDLWFSWAMKYLKPSTKFSSISGLIEMAKKDRIKVRTSQRTQLGMARNNRLGKTSQGVELFKSSRKETVEIYSLDHQHHWWPSDFFRSPIVPLSELKRLVIIILSQFQHYMLVQSRRSRPTTSGHDIKTTTHYTLKRKLPYVTKRS